LIKIKLFLAKEPVKTRRWIMGCGVCGPRKPKKKAKKKKK